MKSFQEIYTELQDQSGDDGSSQLTIFKRHINDTQSTVLGDHSWKFLERIRNIATEADTARYTLHADLRKIIKLVTLDSSGQVDQIPTPVEDADFWEALQFRNLTSSDITQYYYQEGNDVLLWPAFSTAGLNLKVRYRIRTPEMTLADYTTGTITSITNGASALVGSSTLWTAQNPLHEQWLRIAKATGDYRWYRVDSIDSDTAITLEKSYLGTTIAAASLSYTLGEMPVIPEEYHNLLFYRPMALHYMKMEDMVMAKSYWGLYDGGYEIGKSKKPEGLLGKFIKEQAGMLDAKYFPAQGDRGRLSSEFLAKDTDAILG
ncbi:hypothetical protein LCGC14_1848230 [marine sediment metagenome]|uniref:Uncharacterized protein n=1 Tax=marine sediment metagenome TaxID=412755 RepID=A0A0F9GBA8_9ZZZZ|nr:hypothetical protein [Pricia sp.]